MKRSEMVDLIAKHIANARFVSANNLDEHHADHLLHELEQKGMLPPKTPVDDGQGFKFWSNEWEPETDDDNYCGAV